ncbi:MBL fold metallo-hydrolase [Azohydromonas caseinilytica]|uniref:MBL fold metallo-hydrolase n=1 Tax=Azohydromonas caseinilytica TaxID=2728836 RepID=A0A848FBN5_9BURK|nr:MBL fold metallo-hydrolase [Azohydromonas caseinilytica]NML15849.1 MBL fold metallo-hydrolase [Azohydromonas caseinilytica]
MAALALGSWAQASTAAVAALPPARYGQPLALAPGVFALPGGLEGAEPDNQGAVGNLGLIDTLAGPVLVETGGSYRLARWAISEARRLTGRRPVLAVITQARPEFLMGGAAFEEAGIPVLAHADTAELMALRCHECLRRLRADLGEAAMRGTRLVLPGRRIEAGLSLELGGRRIELLHLNGHTSGDLVVLAADRGVAFAGALVPAGRIPEIDPGREATPWRAALRRLGRQEGLRTLVPGYGAPGPAAGLVDAVEAYLAALESQVQALLDAGVDLLEAQRRVELPAWRGWARYEAFHKRNVQRQYLAAELRWLGGVPDPGAPR